MRSAVVTILVLAFLAISSMAQDVEVAKLKQASSINTLGTRPAPNPFSLLDLSKLQFSHSYSMTFLSGGSGSGSAGLLNTSVFYEISPKLSLQLDLGVLHNSGAIWGDANNDATLLPGFILDFHPSDKFSMVIGVTRMNPAAMPVYYPAIGYGRYNNMRLSN